MAGLPACPGRRDARGARGATLDGTPVGPDGHARLAVPRHGSPAPVRAPGPARRRGGFAPGPGWVRRRRRAAPPGVIGDFQPISKVDGRVRRPRRHEVPQSADPRPPPSPQAGNPGIVSGNGTTSILYKLTGLKISDNQSPVPRTGSSIRSTTSTT